MNGEVPKSLQAYSNRRQLFAVTKQRGQMFERRLVELGNLLRSDGRNN